MNNYKIYTIFWLISLLTSGCTSEEANDKSRLTYSFDTFEWVNYTYSFQEESFMKKSSSNKIKQYAIKISYISETDNKLVYNLFVDNINGDKNVTFSTEELFLKYNFQIEIDKKKYELVKLLNFSEFINDNKNNNNMQQVFAYYKNDNLLIEETIINSLQYYFISKIFYVNNLEYSLKDTIWSEIEYNLYGERIEGKLGINAEKESNNHLNIRFNTQYDLEKITFIYSSQGYCNFNLNNNFISKLELRNTIRNSDIVFEITELLIIKDFKILN